MAAAAEVLVSREQMCLEPVVVLVHQAPRAPAAERVSWDLPPNRLRGKQHRLGFKRDAIRCCHPPPASSLCCHPPPASSLRSTASMHTCICPSASTHMHMSVCEHTHAHACVCAGGIQVHSCMYVHKYACASVRVGDHSYVRACSSSTDSWFDLRHALVQQCQGPVQHTLQQKIQTYHLPIQHTVQHYLPIQRIIQHYLPIQHTERCIGRSEHPSACASDIQKAMRAELVRCHGPSQPS